MINEKENYRALESFDIHPLKAYVKANKFCKAALTAIAVQASAEDTKSLRDAFIILDR